MKNQEMNLENEVNIIQLNLTCGCRPMPQKMMLAKIQPKDWFTRFDTAYYKCTLCLGVKKAYIHEPLFFGQPELIVEELTGD